MPETLIASSEAAIGPSRSRRAREDARLFERYQRTGDPAARAELTERFLPLARSLARRYERGGESLDDLTQVASLALLKAIDRFDPQRAVAFSSFAVPTIVGELKRYFRDYGWSVRVPRALQELALRAQRESDRFASEHGHAPTAGQLAQRLGVDVEQILEAREAVGARRAASLERPREGADDDERPVHELGVEDPGFAAAEDAATISRLTAVALGTRPGGAALALRAGPHAVRDRRADRVLADARVADPAPRDLPHASAGRGRARRRRLSRPW